MDDYRKIVWIEMFFRELHEKKGMYGTEIKRADVFR